MICEHSSDSPLFHGKLCQPVDRSSSSPSAVTLYKSWVLRFICGNQFQFLVFMNHNSFLSFFSFYLSKSEHEHSYISNSTLFSALVDIFPSIRKRKHNPSTEKEKFDFLQLNRSFNPLFLLEVGDLNLKPVR